MKASKKLRVRHTSLNATNNMVGYAIIAPKHHRSHQTQQLLHLRRQSARLVGASIQVEEPLNLKIPRTQNLLIMLSRYILNSSSDSPMKTLSRRNSVRRFEKCILGIDGDQPGYEERIRSILTLKELKCLHAHIRVKWTLPECLILKEHGTQEASREYAHEASRSQSNSGETKDRQLNRCYG